MKINYKAEVRLSRIPRQETINQYDVEKITNLVISNDRLLKDNRNMHESLTTLLSPLIEARVPENIIDKIMNNKFKTSVFVKDCYPEDPILSQVKIGWYFEIPLYDLGKDFYNWRYGR